MDKLLFTKTDHDGVTTVRVYELNGNESTDTGIFKSGSTIPQHECRNWARRTAKECGFETDVVFVNF